MREIIENSKEFKKGYKEFRYISVGVGIFFLGLVITLVLLFICRYVENRNRDVLNFWVVNVFICSMFIWRNRYENKDLLKTNMKDIVRIDRNDD